MIEELERDKILKAIPNLPVEKQDTVKRILEELNKRKIKTKSQNSFLDYVKHMWPEFINGRHHKIMAEAFERVAKGELKRLIVNMPPRHTKSEFSSYLLPSWYLGRFPNKKSFKPHIRQN